MGEPAKKEGSQNMTQSFREKMHPAVSNAEIEVFKALSLAGLTSGMVTQRPIVLKSTVPDFQWGQKRKAIYLDGAQVHRNREEWDCEVDELLEKKGWAVLRIRYTPPLIGKALQDVLGQIKKFLNADEE